MQYVVEPIEGYSLSKKNRPKTLFSKVGVIGCGMVGRDIVRMVSRCGIDVVFIELSEDRIKVVFDKISDELDYMIGRWGMTNGEKRAILSRITGSIHYKDLKGCSIVIESIKSKSREFSKDERKEIFRKIEKQVDIDTIIATNSTTLIISELASSLKYQERTVSLHFISQDPDASMVEVSRGVHTSDKAFKKVCNFANLIGKRVIETIESPGVVSTRLFVPLINEACDILLEGVATLQDIDRTMKIGFGLPLGPFEMADKIGLDIVLRWMDNLYNEFGDIKYKASPLIKRKIRANHLGRKTDMGFYRYKDFKKIGVNY